MKAAVIYEPHTPIRVEDLDLDDPGPQEVRVKLVGGGICRSDYHTVDGHTTPISFPWLLGHEGSGIVQQVGAAVTDLARGDHVIFSLAGQCGYCRSCVTGRPNLCETYPSYMRTGPDSRFSKDGVPYAHGLATFAQETIVRSSSLVKVPDDIPLEKVCLIGCAVMTGVGAVINRAKVETGSNVAVLGCGGVGLNVVQGARLASAAKIIAVDTSDFKLEKAGEMGATHFVNADKEDPVKRVLDISNGGVDYAFEVVGFPSIVRQAFDCTAPGGTAVMVGVPPTGAEVSVPAQPLFRDRGLLGTFYGAGRPRVDFPWLLDLYMDGRLKLDEMITRYRPLEEINEAYEDMKNGVATRSILTFE